MTIIFKKLVDGKVISNTPNFYEKDFDFLATKPEKFEITWLIPGHKVQVVSKAYTHSTRGFQPETKNIYEAIV